MINEIKATTATFEHNDQTFEVEPMAFEDQLEIEEMAGGDDIEQARQLLELHLEEKVDVGYNADEDDLNDVQLGFLVKLNEAIEEANGLEGFTDDQLRQAQTRAQ